ncbi:hypothetical protein [Bifidobacterium aerophilum]|uniref:Uncharacterized protein n=1 Tax=Bifidobacterium aerophilum TaxID=1798155 RepID=A0A6N9Z538_9BIFI|nr:hypothetical protein [Bifidobacterium aerophilum]NEG89817.1 hypothetical protein [Bifidobacterium aerophilum]
MSRETVEWARSVEGLDPESRKVLLGMAADADHDGRVVMREHTPAGIVEQEYFIGPAPKRNAAFFKKGR